MAYPSPLRGGITAALLRRRVLAEQRKRFLHRGHELRREDNGGILLDRNLRHGLQRTQLKRDRMLRNDVGGLAKLDGSLILAFGGDDLGAALALGLGFL